MNSYLATFHSQFGALSTAKLLQAQGISAELSTVPRALSASCGLCVNFHHGSWECAKAATELEAIYQLVNGEYKRLVSL
jgi:hypothetical protein